MDISNELIDVGIVSLVGLCSLDHGRGKIDAINTLDMGCHVIAQLPRPTSDVENDAVIVHEGAQLIVYLIRIIRTEAISVDHRLILKSITFLIHDCALNNLVTTIAACVRPVASIRQENLDCYRLIMIASTRGKGQIGVIALPLPTIWQHNTRGPIILEVL